MKRIQCFFVVVGLAIFCESLYALEKDSTLDVARKRLHEKVNEAEKNIYAASSLVKKIDELKKLKSVIEFERKDARQKLADAERKALPKETIRILDMIEDDAISLEESFEVLMDDSLSAKFLEDNRARREICGTLGWRISFDELVQGPDGKKTLSYYRQTALNIAKNLCK